MWARRSFCRAIFLCRIASAVCGLAAKNAAATAFLDGGGMPKHGHTACDAM